MNDNIATRSDEEVVLSKVVVNTGELLDGVENLVCDLGRRLYGYDMVPTKVDPGNCMEQALVADRERIAEIRNKLEVICRRL